jgi:transposase-like protein
MDETVIKVGPEYIWLLVAIELKVKRFLGLAYQRNGTCLLQSGLSQV